MCTEAQFKRMVDNSVEEKCLEYLIAEKNKKMKVMHIKYKKPEIQRYLLPSLMSMNQAKDISMLRARMLDTKDNYPNKHQNDQIDSNQTIVIIDVEYTYSVMI